MPDQFIPYPSPSTNPGSPVALRAANADVDQQWPTDQVFEPLDFGQYGLFDPEFASLMYMDPTLPPPQVPFYPLQSNPYAEDAFIMTPTGSEMTPQPDPAYVPANAFYPAVFPTQPAPLPPLPSAQPRQHTQLPPLTTSLPRGVPAFLPSPPPSGLPYPQMFQHQQQQKQQHQQPPQQQFTRPTNPVGRPLSGTHQVAVTGEPERLALPFPGDLPCSGCEVIM